MRPHRAPLLLTVVGMCAALSLTSCGDDAAEPTAAATSEATGTPSASSPVTPSSSTSTTSATPPTSSAPTTTVSTSAPSEPASATAVDLPALLLPAGRVGKLNQEWRWFVGNDFDREPEQLVACHRAGLADIGADEVAVREYTSDLDATVRAHQLVAAFPDEVTARRAYAVLESWHRSCEQRLESESRGRDDVRVSAAEPVSTPAGRALTYVTFRPTATGTSAIENVGAARDGRVITLVVVKLEGDDFNYPRGRTPAAITLRNAARPGG